MFIKNCEVKLFRGNYHEYLDFINKPKEINNNNYKNEKLILENKLSEIIGRLSMPSRNDDIVKLDEEYKQILRKIRENHC